jgi:hypothetical protein
MGHLQTSSLPLMASVATRIQRTTQVAVIIDTNAGDTGELRYKIADAEAPLAAGRLELKIKRLDDDLGNGDAFITLFNSATNNGGAILDFRIKDDSFGVRSPAPSIHRHFRISLMSLWTCASPGSIPMVQFR